MLKVSKTYVIHFDLTDDDKATLTVSKYTGSKLEVIKMFFNDEAQEIYKKLLDNCSWKENENENENDEC